METYLAESPAVLRVASPEVVGYRLQLAPGLQLRRKHDADAAGADRRDQVAIQPPSAGHAGSLNLKRKEYERKT